MDGAGNIFVADTFNNRIQQFGSGGNYMTQFGGIGVGKGQFSGPAAIATDSAGNIFVADQSNNRIQKFDNSGHYITQFGSLGNGAGQLFQPSGVVVDSSGNVWVADFLNNRIVEFAPAKASVSGTLVFDGIAGNAPAQNVTFTFRSNDGAADVVQTLSVPASGAYTLTGLFSKAGILHIKADKYLAANVSIDLTGGNLVGQNAALPAGDANNDNSVDSSDFGVLIGAFNSFRKRTRFSGYDPTADFDGNGSVDSNDFGLLIGNFNQMGAL